MFRARFHTQAGCCAFALLLVVGPGGTADPPKESPAKIDLDLIPDPDVEWLKREKVATDDAGLLAFLRSCQGKDVSPADIDAAIAKLMTGSKAEQDDAAKRLAEHGTIAVPSLRKHRTASDADAAKRVRDCLEKIEEIGDKPLARPAMRRLLIRRPAGTAEAMLDYLPFASDPAAEEDIYYGLDALAEKGDAALFRGGKELRPLFQRMLKDAQPSRRAVSACILGRRGNAEQKQAVRDLLKDTDALVRLRAAQGLLAGRDACGVATLIELLTDPSIEIAWQAEELLRWVSNETAPDAVVGSGEPEASAKAQQAWKTWAKDHAAKIDFAALEQEPRRPLLLLGYERTKGKLWIFGSDGMTRCEWKLKGGLADAQYVPGGTVLTLHEQPVREKPMLAERDRGGTVLWQYDNLADPKYVQRLSNGHFFVAEFVDVAAPYLTYKVFAAGARLVETQPKKHSTFGHALYRRANGKLVVAMFGLYRPEPSSFTGVQEYDPATDHNRDFVGTGGRFGAKVYVESAPEGGILASGFQHIPNRKDRMAEVVEFDRDGDKIWKYQVPEGTHAFRLAGGNTLICADNRVVEASADRRMVGEIPMELSPSVARPCLGLVRFGFDAFPTNIDLEIDVDYRVRCLGKKNPRTRINALRRLADFRHLAARVIPKLKAHVLDPDAGVQDEMKKTLVAIGVDEIPRLIQEIKIDDPERRYLAVGRIGGFRNGPGVLETLLDALKDENAKVRWMAVRSLGNRDSDPQSRRFYSDLPGSYRQSAEKIVPHLIRAFQDSDERVQQSAFATLGVLGPDAAAAVPKLIELLRSEKSMSVRANAAVTLGRVGHASNDARAALLTAVKETKDPTLLEWSIQGLCALRPVPNEAAKLLIQHYLASDNSSRVIRETCLFNILQIGGNDKATRDFFWQVLKDETTGLAKRCEIATRLVEIESDTTDLMDFMTNLAARQAELSDRRHVTESIRWQKKTLRQRQQHSMR